jgi:hypothetical protein
MAEKPSQSLASHKRWDPLYHFFTVPVFLLTVIWSAAHFIRHPGWHSAGLFVFLTAASVAIFKLRFYALKVQDRVIRLEERMRLAALLSDPLRARIPELTEGQCIALRFAADAEVPTLVERALNEKLSRADLKKSIRTWRPDYWRV